MKSSMRISGFNGLLTDIGVAKEKLSDVLEEVIEDAAFRTQAAAIKGIQGGSKTGTIYEKYHPRRTHQASAFGQLPASDTGELASSIKIEVNNSTFYSVGTNLTHGFYLEFGTSEMSHRQWLTPSFELAIAGVVRDAKKRYAQKLGGN